MPLAAGTRLGPYEVLGLIGAGGMGEVYKARDTRLDRTVAVKVLPAELASSPDRRARFAREAKAVSQLAHPHICVLHDVGQATIPSSESPAASPVTVDYLVMEYLEGETLAEHLARVAARTPHSGPSTPPASGRSGTSTPGRTRRGAPLPLDETLRIGTELAEALAAAHKAGIIHRDLKPGNVMLTPAGAKVLDFGLARLHAAEAAPGATSAATRTVEPLTDAGTRLGTIPYMAPEQVEGKDADARSDVFALGAILYEMATGHRAFEGETAASVAAAILDREPELVTAAQPLTPPAFEHVVATCLAKDPETRWQAAGDVARELRWIADQSRRGLRATGGLSDEAAAAVLAASRRRRNKYLALGLSATVAVVAALTATLTWLAAGHRVTPNTAVRRVFLDTRLADGVLGGIASNGTLLGFNRPSRTVLALTPDDRLVFAGRQGGRDQLYVRDLNDWEAKPLLDTDGAESPFLSPDGRWVGFWVLTPKPPNRHWQLKKVPIDGGLPPVLITPQPLPSGSTTWPPFGASWGDDDTIVFSATDDGGLWRVPARGGTPQVITTPARGEYGHRLPHVLPGARAVLFTVTENVWDWEAARVVVHRFGTNEWETIVRGAADARYVPTGHLVYFRRGQLMAAAFDLASLKITGNERALVANIMQSTNGTNSGFDVGAAQAAVSANGTLAYLVGGQVPDLERRLILVDRRGNVEPLSAPPRPYFVPRLSPDGSSLAVGTGQSERRIWVHHLRVAGSLMPVTSPELEARQPVWAENGERLVFGGTENGEHGLFWTRADGTQPAARVASSTISLAPASWTRDGRLLYLRSESRTSSDIWMLSHDGGKWDGKALLGSTTNEMDAQVSPDGRWLAYTSTESGQMQVYLRRFPDLTQKRQVSSAGGHNVVWARKGNELFYIRGSSQAWELVARKVGPDGSIGQAETPLFRLGPIRTTGYNSLPGFDVTPDGQRFVFTQLPESSLPPLNNRIYLVFNWFEELKAKVPAGGAK